MSETKVTVYCTRYALTKGIIPVTGEINPAGYFFERRDDGKLGLFLSRNDYKLTKEEALADGEARRVRKLKALERQLSYLQIADIKIAKEQEGQP